jgi:hypothetical protein
MSQIASATWWESKLARRLDFVILVATLVVMSRVALEEDLSWVAWALAGVAVVILTLTRWPYGALFVLIGLSAMPRFFVEVFGWKARPEHFAVVIVSMAVCVWLLRHKGKMRVEKVDYWVLAYVAINYASSAFASPVPSATLRWALMNNLAVLPYFLIRLLVRDRETLGRAFRLMLGVGIAELFYGILCYASHHAFGTTTGMGIGQYLVDVAAPYGSLYEPNLFGAYAGFYAVLFLALYVFGEQHRLGSLICFIVASLATALSLSRAALVALVMASCWVFWKARHSNTAHRNKLPILIPLAALTLVIAVTVVGGVMQKRFSSLYSQGLEEETAVTRYVVIFESLKDFPNHPLLGNGTASLQLSFEWAKYIPEWEGERAWVANVVVRILHDTGLLGLTAFLGFLISLWVRIRRTLRGWNSQVPLLIGLSAGALLYVISFQSTDGTILAFCWVHLGFLASAAILLNGARDTSGDIDRVPDAAG